MIDNNYYLGIVSDSEEEDKSFAQQRKIAGKARVEPHIVGSKIFEISNSFLFVTDKEKKSEFAELFPNFK